jgi:PAS domain S-box-containing protein
MKEHPVNHPSPPELLLTSEQEPRNVARGSQLGIWILGLGILVLVVIQLLAHKWIDTLESFIQTNHHWVEVAETYEDLKQVVAQINAPGNDVFESRDVRYETQRLNQSYQLFKMKMRRFQEDCVSDINCISSNLMDGNHSPSLLNQPPKGVDVQLQSIDNSVSEMVRLTNLVFKSFEAGNTQLAGRNMSLMDKSYNKTLTQFGILNKTISNIQKENLNKLLFKADTMLKVQDYITFISLFLGIGVLVYSRRMNCHLEEAERRIRMNEMMLRSCFKHAPIGEAVVDLSGRFLRVNENYCSMLGYSEEELQNMNFQTVTHPDDLEMDLTLHDEVRVGKRERYQLEKRYICKDGSSIWVELHVSTLKNVAGKPIGYIGQVKEITEQKRIEATLQSAFKALQDLKTAIDSSCILAITDTRGVITEVNDMFCQISQYSREELVGQTHRIINSYYHPESFWIEMWKTISSGVVWRGEIRNRAKDGSYYWVNTTIIPYLDEYGKPYQYLAIRSDITERKQLQEAQERIFDKSLDMVCVWGFDGYIKQANPATLAFTGYSLEELTSTPFIEFIYPDDRAFFQSNMALQVSGESLLYKYRMMIKSGEIRWASWTSYPDLENREVYAIGRDVTANKLQEEKLAQILTQQQAILDNIPFFAWLKDKEGRFIAVNTHLAETLETSKEAMIGKSDYDYFPYNEASKFQKDDAWVVETGQKLQCEEQFVNVDGSIIWLETSKVPIRDAQGLVIGSAGIAQDITKRRLMELALRQEKEYISHIISAAPTLICGIASDGTTTFANEAVCKSTGYNLEELIGQNWWELFYPDGAYEQVTQLFADLEKGPVVNYEMTLTTKNGAQRIIAWSSVERHNAAGEIIEIVGLGTDVTEQRLLLEAQRLTEAQFQAALEGSLDGFFILGCLRNETGRIIDFVFQNVNQRGAELFKRSREDIVGLTLLEVFPYPETIRYIESYAEVLETGEPYFNEFPVDESLFTASWLQQQVVPLADGVALTVRNISEHKQMEEGLRKGEAKYQGIVLNMPGMVYQFMLRTDGGIEVPYVSQNCIQIYEMTPEEIMTNPNSLLDAIHPADRGAYDQALNQSLLQLAPLEWEGRLLLPSGTIKWIRLAARPEWCNQDALLWDGLVMDITERRWSEEALKLSEERFELAVRGASDGIWDWNILTNDVYYSPRFKALLGYQDDEFENIFASLEDRLHPDEYHPVMRALFEHLTESSSFSQELRLMTKSGEYRWFVIRGQAIWNEHHQPERMAGSITDITERKNIETVLQFSQFSIQKANDAIVWLDDRGRLTAVNQAASNLFCYPQNDILEMYFFELFPKETPDDWQAKWVALKQAGSLIFEGTGLTKVGNSLPLEISANYLYFQDKEYGCFFIRDITERVEKERAETANKQKSEFLANMSHEIRTPLNGILGMNSLLLETELSPEQKEYVEIIRHSGDSLLSIVNDILDFSKIEAGKMDIEHVPFDFSLAVDELKSLVVTRAEEKNLEFILRFDPNAPRLVIGDPGRIRQVMLNLLNNAIKFTQSGYVFLDISCQTQSTTQALYKITVEDTGIGIPQDKLNTIFDKFTQEDASTTRYFGGTGLGLAICKQLVRLMGGDIGVVSRKGKGSTFWFTLLLPIQDVDSSVISAPRSSFERSLTQSSSQRLPEGVSDLRVLLLESHSVKRNVITECLDSWHIRYDCLLPGESLVNRLNVAVQSCDPFHIVLVDDGFEEMASIPTVLKRESSLTIPVLMTTARKRFRLKQDPSIGYHYSILKPPSQSEILDMLMTVWRERLDTTDGLIATKPDADDTLMNCDSESDHPIQSAGRKKAAGAEHSDEGNAPTEDGAHLIGRKLRVLLAEDNVVNQKVTSRLLEKLGVIVDVVANGREVLGNLELFDYDLILMDCQMPEMDGYQTTHHIRSGAGRHTQIPIIALTANALKGDREKCLEAGMNDYLSKPLNFNSLKLLIEEMYKRLRE